MKKVLAFLLIAFFFSVPCLEAANKVYVARETALEFKESGGDAVLTLNNLAAGASALSARHDLGAGSTAQDYEVRAVIEFETAPVVGEQVIVYISSSDGTSADGNVGTTSATLADNNQLVNMIFGPVVSVGTITADTQMIASAPVRISTRYFSVAVHNDTADNLQATNNLSWIQITPIPPEVQ